MAMNTVKLYGPLAEVFGPEFRMDVRTPQEAFRALNSQLPGWLDEIRHGEYYLIREMANGDFALDERTMFLGMANTTLHILPVAEGQNKKGVGKMILGVGLIAAAIFIPGAGIAGVALAHAGGFAVAGLALGLSLLFGGAAMLLSPTPKAGGPDSKSNNSFLFGGDFQTVGQGMAVPITYGRDRVRALPIATMLTTEQLRVGVGASYDNNGTGGDSITFRTPVPANGDGFIGGNYQNSRTPTYGDPLGDSPQFGRYMPDTYLMGGL